MNKPLVSVILPVYNGFPFLPFAIDSLLNQSYENIEILILDETTNAVDELTQDKIIDEIFSYAKVNNMTVIVVSHDQKVLYKCEKNFLLKNQKIHNL